MNVKNTIISGTLSLGLSNIAMRFFSFLTVFVIVRAISVYDYGFFNLFMSLAGIITAFSNLGMEELMIADVSRELGNKNFSRAKSILVHLFRLRLLLLAVLLLIALIFKNYLESKYGLLAVQYFWLLIILTILQYIKGFISVVFQIYEKFKLLSISNILDVVVKFIFIISFFYWGKLNVVSLIVCYLLGMFFSSVVFIPRVKNILGHLKAVPTEKAALVYAIFRGHGKWQIGIHQFGSLMNTVKYWLLKIIVSVEAVGYLALAQNLYSVLGALVPIRTVIFPIIAKKINEKAILGKLILKATKYSLILYALLVFGAIFIVSPLIPYVFPQYAAAVPLFNILIFRMLFNASSLTQPSLLIIYREQKFLFWCAAVSLISNVAFSTLLMAKFGIVGAVYEAIINIFIITVMRELYLRKKYQLKTISFKSLFSIDETDKLLLEEIVLKIRNKLIWKKQF